jgi:hypothetical protein
MSIPVEHTDVNVLHTDVDTDFEDVHAVASADRLEESGRKTPAKSLVG